MEPRSRSDRGAPREARDDPLSLDPQTMRELGYRTVDALVDWLSDPSVPALGPATALRELDRADGSPPAQAEEFDVLLERLFSEVVPRMARNDHPRAFAFVPGCGTWPGALADLIASALNVEASTWLLAAGPIEVELEVLGWFKEWIGYPARPPGSSPAAGRPRT